VPAVPVVPPVAAPLAEVVGTAARDVDALTGSPLVAPVLEPVTALVVPVVDDGVVAPLGDVVTALAPPPVEVPFDGVLAPALPVLPVEPPETVRVEEAALPGVLLDPERDHGAVATRAAIADRADLAIPAEPATTAANEATTGAVAGDLRDRDQNRWGSIEPSPAPCSAPSAPASGAAGPSAVVAGGDDPDPGRGRAPTTAPPSPRGRAGDRPPVSPD
jgi:hypothetical protein